MSVKKYGDRWGIDVEVGNRRLRLRSPENSRQGALAHEAHIRKKLLWQQQHPEEAIKPPTFAEFVPEWLDTYVRANNKPSEIYAKESRLRVHLVPFFGHLRLNEITGLWIERYKSLKVKEGLHPKTVNNQLAILSKCLRIAEEWKLLDEAPRVRLLRKIPLPEIRFLSHDECRRILDAAVGTTWWTMILIALHAGLRRCEILALRHEDIDLERQQLHVRRSFSRDVLSSPKNYRSRVVPLSRTLHAALSRLERGDGYVFTDAAGAPWNGAPASWQLCRIGRRAGVPAKGDLGWHTLRHSFASHLAMAGVPLLMIKDLLGHGTIEMTMRYAHLAPSALAHAVTPLETLGSASGPSHGTFTALRPLDANGALPVSDHFFANQNEKNPSAG